MLILQPITHSLGLFTCTAMLSSSTPRAFSTKTIAADVRQNQQFLAFFTLFTPPTVGRKYAFIVSVTHCQRGVCNCCATGSKHQQHMSADLLVRCRGLAGYPVQTSILAPLITNVKVHSKCSVGDSVYFLGRGLALGPCKVTLCSNPR